MLLVYWASGTDCNDRPQQVQGDVKRTRTKTDSKSTRGLSDQAQGPFGFSMDRLVWRPDHHAGRGRRYAFNWPGNWPGRVAWLAQKSAWFRFAIGLGQSCRTRASDDARDRSGRCVKCQIINRRTRLVYAKINHNKRRIIYVIHYHTCPICPTWASCCLRSNL